MRKLEPGVMEKFFANAIPMDRETQSTTELQALRVLCDESLSREQRLSLMQSLSQNVFIDPEHQVVYESLRALLSRGPVSVGRLRVHLNNRGFPDTEVEKYFQPATSRGPERRPPDEVTL